MTPQDNVENPYVMKAIARVLSICKEDILPFSETTFSALLMKLEKIYRAPTIPEFGYYLFESFACLINVLHKSNISKLEWIENQLLPIFCKIIVDPSADVFSPFAFQLMAYLLELRPKTLPAHYQPLLQDMISPTWWQQQGNVPALSRLLQAYVTNGTDFIISKNLLIPILGVFQKLLSSRINDVLGFGLLQTIVMNVPLKDLTPLLKEIFNVIFTRIQSKKTTQLLKGFIIFLSTFINKHGPNVPIDALSSLQNGIFMMVLQSIFLPNVETITDKIERKTVSIALIHILTKYGPMTSKPYEDLWTPLFAKTIHLLEGLEQETPKEDVFNAEEENAGYSSGFSVLRNAPLAEVDYFEEVEPRKLLAISLNGLAKSNLNKLRGLVGASGDNYKLALQSYYQTAGLNFCF